MFFIYEYQKRRRAIPVGRLVEITPFFETTDMRLIINPDSKGDLMAMIDTAMQPRVRGWLSSSLQELYHVETV